MLQVFAFPDRALPVNSFQRKKFFLVTADIQICLAQMISYIYWLPRN